MLVSESDILDGLVLSQIPARNHSSRGRSLRTRRERSARGNGAPTLLFPKDRSRQMELREFTLTLERMTPANLHAVARAHAEHHSSPADEIDALRPSSTSTPCCASAPARATRRVPPATPTRAVTVAAEAGDILLPDPEITQVARAAGAHRPRDRRRPRGRSRRALAAPRVVAGLRARVGRSSRPRRPVSRRRGRSSRRFAGGAGARTIAAVPLTDRLLLGPGPSNPYPEVAAGVRPAAARAPRPRLPRAARRDVGPPAERSSAPRTR